MKYNSEELMVARSIAKSISKRFSRKPVATYMPVVLPRNVNPAEVQIKLYHQLRRMGLRIGVSRLGNVLYCRKLKDIK